MKIKSTAAGLAVTMGLALGMAACGSTPPPSGDSETSAEEAVQGGEMTMVLGVEAVRGLDPAMLFNLTPSGDANRMAAIYDVLISSDAATGEIEPGLAESFTSDDEGKVWTLTLRKELKFSDGTPLDAEAVLFNYQRIQDPATNSPLAPLLRGVEFTVTDPQTLQLSLESPNRQFNQILATNLTHVGSPAAMASEDFANQPVGAGPFVLSEWVRDDHMTLTRNPDYYQDGKPYLDSVTFKPISDPAQRINSVSSSQANMAVLGSELSFIAQAEQRGLDVTKAHAGGGPMIIFNTTREPFDDLRARQAVQLALDTADLANVIDPGAGAPESLYGPNSPFASDGPVFPGQNVEETQQLFDELAADGSAVEFTITSPASGLFKRTGEYVQSRLSEFENVSVNLEVVDNATIDERVFRKRDYDMSVQVVPVADPEPNLSKLLMTGGQTNYMGYSNPRADELILAGRNASAEDERKKAYQDLEELVVDEVPVLPIRSQIAYTIHSNTVQGIALQGDGALLYDDLWLQQ